MLPFAAGAAPASLAGVDSGAGDRGVFEKTLSNGLRVVVVEDHAAPVVQTSMWYRFGSLYETPGKTGLAHATEHMMFRGTKTLSAGGLDDITARLGAQVNGQTDYDYTQYYFVTPADKYSVAVAIEADRMQHLALRPDDWAIEKRAVLNEIDGDESSPFYSLLSSVRAAAYPDIPAGRTPLGKRSDVAQSTVADIGKYYHEWYAPNNAALIVSGDVQHDAVFEVATRDFGKIAARRLPAHAAVHPKAASGKTVESQFPFPFEVLDLAYAVPGDTEAGEPAVSTLATLIPNERGPFYQALVETNIAVAIQANSDTQLRGGLMNVFIVLNPGHTGAEAQSVFQTTMDRVLKSGFSTDLVTAAKRQTIAERDYSADSISGYGDLVGYTYGVVGEKVGAEDARLNALTGADLLAAAHKYLSVPNVVGHLRPNDAPKSGSSQKSNASATDNFSSRVPNGPIVEPAALKAAVEKPSTARSKLHPTTFTLSNGMRVIVQEKHDRPTVYISGSIESSPAFVPPGQEGLIRLASTVSDFGSERYDFTALRKVTDDIGAIVNIGQSFSAQGFARDFDTLLGILADGEEHPTFPDRWLALQRDQIANSINTENSISGVTIDRAYLQHLLSPEDPGLRFATSSSVAGLTRDDLLTYTHRYWRPDLTTIAIVGDVTPAQVRTGIEHAFGTWKNDGPRPNTTQMALPQPASAHEYVGTSANQVYVQLGQPAISRSNPDYYAFNVMSQIIAGSGNFESLLWQELRQKRGLVYSVGSTLKADRDRGDFEISLSASPGKVVPAIRIVRSEIERLQTQPVTATELAEAKTRVVSEALLAQESASAQVDELLDIPINGLPTDYYATLNDRYAKLTPADIQRVAKQYLRPNDLIQIYAGPSGPWASRGL
ncbi:MAG: insulinase family protein [Candidatus Eremiobacteraeota bacterium]|nr:insulinase family protein [Candidatus Eremiobacteraeota bacterium]